MQIPLDLGPNKPNGSWKYSQFKNVSGVAFVGLKQHTKLREKKWAQG